MLRLSECTWQFVERGVGKRAQRVESQPLVPGQLWDPSYLIGYEHSSQGTAVTALPHRVPMLNKAWSHNSVKNPHSQVAAVKVFNFYVHNASGFMLAILQS